MMDPLFGLPCINESRAMDNARNRNYIAEKNLALKFESIDLAKKSASDRLLSRRCNAGDSLECLDLSMGKSPRCGHRDKNMTRSMSLRDFDKRITEAKDRKSILQSPILKKNMTTSAKASNPNSAIIVRRENTILVNTFDSDTSHIVQLEEHPRCLPINRQKHAMRDAYERATTEDVHFKRQRALPSSQSPQSFSPHARGGYEQFSCDSPVLSRPSNVKHYHKDRKKSII